MRYFFHVRVRYHGHDFVVVIQQCADGVFAAAFGTLFSPAFDAVFLVFVAVAVA